MAKGLTEGLKNYGTREIYLTGSKCYTKRCLWSDGRGRNYIVWYGQLIEVEIGYFGLLHTVEAY